MNINPFNRIAAISRAHSIHFVGLRCRPLTKEQALKRVNDRGLCFTYFPNRSELHISTVITPAHTLDSVDNFPLITN